MIDRPKLVDESKDDIQRPSLVRKADIEARRQRRLSIRLAVTGIIVFFSLFLSWKLNNSVLSLTSKAESPNAEAGNYQYAFEKSKQALQEFIACGLVYKAFVGNPESCPNQHGSDNEGAKTTDWLLVIIGFLQFMIYLRQARILRKQTDIASDTLSFLSTQDRPYLLMENPTCIVRSEPRVGEYTREVIAFFTNYGRSPAIIRSIEFEEASPRWPFFRPQYSNVYEVGPVVGPGKRSVTYGFPVEGWRVEKPGVPYDYPIVPLYFYARVKYGDVSGKFWISSFAFEIDLPRKETRRFGGRRFNNDAKDRDPEDNK